MAATGFDHSASYRLGWGKDQPGTPWIIDQLQRFRSTYLVSPFQNIFLAIPPSELISTTPPNMNPKPLKAIMTETVTTTVDDDQDVVIIVDNDLPPTPV